MKYLFAILILVALLLGCEKNEPTATDGGLPPISGQPGPGIWCIDLHSSETTRDYYIEKYSFDGDLIFRSVPCINARYLVVNHNNGNVIHQQDDNYIIKRSDVGNILNYYTYYGRNHLFTPDCYEMDNSVWFVRWVGDGWKNYIYHLDNNFNILSDQFAVYNCWKIACDQSNGSCWTIGSLGQDDSWSRLININPNGEIVSIYNAAHDPTEMRGMKSCLFDHSLWTATDHSTWGSYLTKYSLDNGSVLYNHEFLNYSMKHIAVNQNDGSVYFSQKPWQSLVGDSKIVKVDSQGNFVWSMTTDCEGLDLDANSLWIAVPPNIILQVSFDGAILKQIETDCQHIKDIAVWDG